MLINALCWIVGHTQRLRAEDRPTFYLHVSGEDVYQIIVQKMPKQERAVA